MMIDFALDAERTQRKSSQDAIYQACLLRFRPIMMTTMAALLGGLPLAVGAGTRLGTTTAAWPSHRRRSDRESGADALYDTGGVSVSRPLAVMVRVGEHWTIRTATAIRYYPGFARG
jgi:hypothetical protein